MKALTDALLLVEQSIAKEKGAFSLFALFLREESLGTWDVVVSAPWTEADKLAALKLISERMRKYLAPSDLSLISRIALADPADPEVDAINRAVQVEHSPIEVKDSTFFGLQIKHAHIFASTLRVAEVQQATPSYRLTRRKRSARR